MPCLNSLFGKWSSMLGAIALFSICSHQQVYAVEPNDSKSNSKANTEQASQGVMQGAMRQVDAWSAMPKSELDHSLGKDSKTTPRVRIGLRLTPFTKVIDRAKDGTTSIRFIALEPLQHALRARLDKANHFFLGDYHIESHPVQWMPQMQDYKVSLHIFRRFGAYGELEENLGVVELTGKLQEQKPQLYVMSGLVKQRLRNKLGQPVLDIVAGSVDSLPQAIPQAKREGAPVALKDPVGAVQDR